MVFEDLGYVHFGMPNLANFYKVTDKFVQKYQNIVWLDWQPVMSTTKYMGICFLPLKSLKPI